MLHDFITDENEYCILASLYPFVFCEIGSSNCKSIVRFIKYFRNRLSDIPLRIISQLIFLIIFCRVMKILYLPFECTEI